MFVRLVPTHRDRILLSTFPYQLYAFQKILRKMSKQNGFHVVTPLIESTGMSKRIGTTVYLKMESSQPTGSFKIRGIGYMCENVRKNMAAFLKMNEEL